jgi:hypothetical protein
MDIHRRTESDFIRMPWKNGGGETLQLAIWPPAAGLDDFDWRISCALLRQDGPFSRFAGIDRSLVLLEGGVLHLSIGEPRGAWPAEIALRPGEGLAAFAGELAIEAHVSDAPLRDFNVMTRRDRLNHRLLPFHLHGEALRGSGHCLLYLTAGQIRAGNVDLCAGELLDIGIGDDESLSLSGEAEGWMVLLDPV